MITFSLVTIVAVTSALLAAVATILARVLLRDIPVEKMLGINFMTMGVTLAVLSPWFYKFILSWQSILLVLLIACIDVAANYFYFKTLEKTEATVATPLLSLTPIVAFILSGLILTEYPPVQSIIGAVVIIVLIVTLSTDRSVWQKFKAATLFPALTSAFLFGVSAVPSKYLLSTLEATNAPTLYMLRAGLIAIFAILLFKDSFSTFDIKTYRFIFFRGLFVIGQWVLLYYALTLGSTGVVLTLANITPVFVLFLSLFFLGEKFSWGKITAAVVILAVSFVVV